MSARFQHYEGSSYDREHDDCDRHGSRPAGERSPGEIVSLAKMFAASSVGAKDVQDDRRLGRQQIADYAPPTPEGQESITHRADLAEDQKIADELEHAGCTFEAEMRYRRVAVSYGFSPDRLAPMLDAKGKYDEALEWYVAAALRGDDANSLMRLALACDLRGHHKWARRLLGSGIANLRTLVFEKVLRAVEAVAFERHLDAARHLTDFSWKEEDADVTYALGTVVAVGGARRDLARLIFACALAKGHALSALSLVDLVPSEDPHEKQTFSGLDALDDLDDLGEWFGEAVSGDGLRRWQALKWAMKTFGRHLDVPCQARGFQEPPNRADGSALPFSVRPVVNTAQQVVILQGYAAMSCSRGSLRAIRKGALEIVTQACEHADALGIGKESDYIGYTLEQARVAFRRDHPDDAHFDGDGRVDGGHSSGGNSAASALSAGSNDIGTFERFLPCYGVVHRFHHSLREDLNENEQRSLILRLAGLTRAEASQVLGIGEAAVRACERAATHKLRLAQNVERYLPVDCPKLRAAHRAQ